IGGRQGDGRVGPVHPQRSVHADRRQRAGARHVSQLRARGDGPACKRRAHAGEGRIAVTDADGGPLSYQNPLQVAALRGIGPGKALVVIMAISLGVLAFLFWLIYFKPAAVTSPAFVNHLDKVNATLNGLSAILICTGLMAIKARRYERHMKLMFAALGSSAL